MVGALHDGNPLVDSILIHMGSMFTTLGKFEDAILVYQRGLKILEREFGKYRFCSCCWSILHIDFQCMIVYIFAGEHEVLLWS